VAIFSAAFDALYDIATLGGILPEATRDREERADETWTMRGSFEVSFMNGRKTSHDLTTEATFVLKTRMYISRMSWASFSRKAVAALLISTVFALATQERTIFVPLRVGFWRMALTIKFLGLLANLLERSANAFVRKYVDT
jgi:hypothetical protein